jgi:hypothetical protein
VRLLLSKERFCSMEFDKSLISYSVFMRFYGNTCGARRQSLYYLYVTYKLNSSIFWGITTFSLFKINRHFGGTYRLHLQGRRICRGRYQFSRWHRTLRRHREANQKGCGRMRLCPSFSTTAFVRKEPGKLIKIVYQNSRCIGRHSK